MILLFLLAATAGGFPTQDGTLDSASSRKVLGSSVVTSVSVIMDAKDTHFADALGKPVPKPQSASQVASPIDLLNPDRYEFYTFDDSGDLVKRLMTLEEIQSIIANSGDGEAETYKPEKKVNDVVNNVQNVLKEEMLSHKNTTSPVLDTPDVSSSWSVILPAIFGNPGHASLTAENIFGNEKPVFAEGGVTADTIMLEEKVPLVQKPAPFAKPAANEVVKPTSATKKPIVFKPSNQEALKDAPPRIKPTGSKKPGLEVEKIKIPTYRPQAEEAGIKVSTYKPTKTTQYEAERIKLSTTQKPAERETIKASTYRPTTKQPAQFEEERIKISTSKKPTQFEEERIKVSTTKKPPQYEEERIKVSTSKKPQYEDDEYPNQHKATTSKLRRTTVRPTTPATTTKLRKTTAFAEPTTTTKRVYFEEFEELAAPQPETTTAKVFIKVETRKPTTPQQMIDDDEIPSFLSSSRSTETTLKATTASPLDLATKPGATDEEQQSSNFGTTIFEDDEIPSSKPASRPTPSPINYGTTVFVIDHKTNAKIPIATKEQLVGILNSLLPQETATELLKSSSSNNFLQTIASHKDESEYPKTTEVNKNSAQFEDDEVNNSAQFEDDEIPSYAKPKPKPEIITASIPPSYVKPKPEGVTASEQSLYAKPKPESSSFSAISSQKPPIIKEDQLSSSLQKPASGLLQKPVITDDYKQASGSLQKPEITEGEPVSTLSPHKPVIVALASSHKPEIVGNKPGSYLKPEIAEKDQHNFYAMPGIPNRDKLGFYVEDDQPETSYVKLEIIQDDKPGVFEKNNLQPELLEQNKPLAQKHKPGIAATVPYLNPEAVEVNSPSTVSYLKPEVVEVNRPSTVSYLKPGVVEVNRPSTVSYLKPEVVEVNQPSTVPYLKPGVVEVKRPSTTSSYLNLKPGFAEENKPSTEEDLDKISVPEILDQLLLTSTNIYEINTELENKAQTTENLEKLAESTTQQKEYTLALESTTPGRFAEFGQTGKPEESALKEKEGAAEGLQIVKLEETTLKDFATTDFAKPEETTLTRQGETTLSLKQDGHDEETTQKDKNSSVTQKNSVGGQEEAILEKVMTIESTLGETASPPQLTKEETTFSTPTTSLNKDQTTFLPSTTSINKEETTVFTPQKEVAIKETTLKPSLVNSIEQLIQQAVGNIAVSINSDNSDGEKVGVLMGNMNDKPMSMVQMETATAASSLFDNSNPQNDGELATAASGLVDSFSTTEEELDLLTEAMGSILSQVVSSQKQQEQQDLANLDLQSTTLREIIASTPPKEWLKDSTLKTVKQDPTTVDYREEQTTENSDRFEESEMVAAGGVREAETTVQPEPEIFTERTTQKFSDLYDPSEMQGFKDEEESTRKGDAQEEENIREDEAQEEQNTRRGEAQEEQSTRGDETLEEQSTRRGETQEEMSTRRGETQEEMNTRRGETQEEQSTRRGEVQEGQTTRRDEEQTTRRDEAGEEQNTNRGVDQDDQSTRKGDAGEEQTTRKGAAGEEQTTSISEAQEEQITRIGETQEAQEDQSTRESEAQEDQSTRKGEAQEEQTTSKGEAQEDQSTRRGEAQEDQSTGKGEAQEERTTSKGEAQEDQSTRLGEAQEDQSMRKGEAQKEQTASKGEAQEDQSTKKGEAQEVQTTSKGEAQEDQSTKKGESQEEQSTRIGETQEDQSTRKGEAQEELSTRIAETQEDQSTRKGEAQEEQSTISGVAVVQSTDDSDEAQEGGPPKEEQNSTGDNNNEVLKTEASSYIDESLSTIPDGDVTTSVRQEVATQATTVKVRETTLREEDERRRKTTPAGFDFDEEGVASTIKVFDDEERITTPAKFALDDEERITTFKLPYDEESPTTEALKKVPTLVAIITKPAKYEDTRVPDLKKDDSPEANKWSLVSTISPDQHSQIKKPVRGETQSQAQKPVRLNQQQKPVRLSGQQKPVRLNEQQKPVGLKGAQQPLRLDKPQIPVRFEEVQNPVRLDEPQKAGGLQGAQKPVRLEEPQTPVRSEEVQKPVGLDEQQKPVDFEEVRPLVEFEEVQRPAQSETQKPVRLEEVQKPVKLETQLNSGMEETTSHLDPDVRQFLSLMNELAFGFWNSVNNGMSAARSVFVSPFAATSLLAMVFLGARGATSGEMNEILRLDDMVTFNPHLILKNITESIGDQSGVATSVILRELYSDKSKGKLLSFYKERAKAFYDGLVEEVGFKEVGDVVRRRTNLMVKRLTQGKVQEFIKDSSIKVKAPLAGVSVSIFQTDCSAASTEARDGELYFVVLPSIRQRRLIPIPAAVWKSGFLAGYEPTLDATAVAIGNRTQTVSTIFVIPGQQGIAAPGDGLARLERHLMSKPTAWNALLKSLIPRPGLEVQIPRFSHRSVINASVALQRMGMKDLFDAQKADLRGLNGVANDLYLSDILQINSFATCGENAIGDAHHSEIYPATADRTYRRSKKLKHTYRDVELLEEPRDYQRAFHDPLHDPTLYSLPLPLRPRQARLPEPVPRLRFDRPFLYFVRHNPTGLILHMGRFNPRLLP